jgi:hypothetical protein
MLLGSLSIVLMTAPVLIVLTPPLGFMYAKIANYYRCSARELVRILRLGCVPTLYHLLSILIPDALT